MGPSKQQEAVGEALRPGEATPVQPSLTALAARRHAVVGKTNHAIIVECRDFAYAAAGNRPAQWGAKYQSGYSEKQKNEEPDKEPVGGSALGKGDQCRQRKPGRQRNPAKHHGRTEPAVPPELPPVPRVGGDVITFVGAKAIFNHHEHASGNLRTRLAAILLSATSPRPREGTSGEWQWARLWQPSAHSPVSCDRSSICSMV